MKLAIHLHHARLIRLLGLVAALLLLVVVVGRQGASAQRPPGWQAGDPITETLPAPSAALQADATTAGHLAGLLGLTGAPGPAMRQRDLRTGQEFDEIALVTPAGVETALLRLDPASGLPVMIVVLERPAGFDRQTVDAASAPGRARDLAGQIGLPLPGVTPRVEWDPGLESWRVSWDRVIDGVPAPGDGTFLNVFPGGQFAGLSRFETPLRQAPAHPVNPAEARKAALAWAVERNVAALKDFRVERPVLEWRAANAFLTPGGSDAPEPELRLVYRVRLEYQIAGETSPQPLDLYVDAGDGSVVGGAATA